MSKTLDLTGATEGSVRGNDALIIKSVPIATLLLVLVQALALFLGAGLGVTEVMFALVVTAIGAVLIRRGSPVRPGLAAAWLAANAATLGMVGVHPEAFSMVAVLNVGLLVVAALVSRQVWYNSLVVLVVSFQGITALVGDGADLTVLGMTAAIGVGLAALVRRVEWTEAGSERTIRTLADERSTVVRLYEVASSIGASTTRAEALPDLLGAVAEAVRARSCAVVLLDESRTTLRLVGPVWVNGSHIPVEDEVTAVVDRSGFSARALRTTRAVRFDRPGAPDLAPILADLGLEFGLVTPLRLEGKESGLLISGDPTTGAFDANDIAELTALAAPVSLVLAQVGRHEATVEMAAQLKEIAEMKSDFVSMVSHELKTPLTSVIGALDTLARPELTTDNPAVQEMLLAARRQAARLRRLIDDLLMMSRIDRGMVRPGRRVVGLVEVVADALAVVPPCDLAVRVPADLAVLGDPDHLGQIVINLIENAVKYGAGSPVRVTAAATGRGEASITVTDHGPGIPASQRERVFERFVRLDGSTQAKVGGTGLGLSIVKMLAEGMGGGVGLTETPGGGASFTVTLPAAG